MVFFIQRKIVLNGLFKMSPFTMQCIKQQLIDVITFRLGILVLRTFPWIYFAHCNNIINVLEHSTILTRYNVITTHRQLSMVTFLDPRLPNVIRF